MPSPVTFGQNKLNGRAGGLNMRGKRKMHDSAIGTGHL